MEQQNVRASPMIVGGLFIGLWLYLVFFTVREFPRINVALWLFWGLIGFAVAGGLYASRIANATVRIAIWIALGIALRFLAMVLIFNQVGEAFAALFTVVGAGLIITGLPGGWNLPGGPAADHWQDANAPR
ncbi:MAG: hypothetical protein ABR586_02160 [Thermoplasmatota archaeon]